MKKTVLLLAVLLAATMAVSAQKSKSNQSKTLVAYFSATGTTRDAAEILAREHSAVLWEIEAAEPYTAADLDWRNKQSRSSQEMQDEESRPTIRQCTNILPYDTIYVGYPIWWGICPRIINSWIDNNLGQLAGKTLIPFATSGGSDVKQSVEYLRKTYPTLKWGKGMLMNHR